MKKLTTSVLAVVLSSSCALAYAQTRRDTLTKTQNIEGVVVTALGIKREKKSLGYATQEVQGDVINKNPTPNFLNNLSGQAAGLDIKQSSNFGGSINVTSRGFKSLTGDNQMLFVVDGVPILNNNVNGANQISGGYGFDYGNAASDIDPNNIETINILKGAAATALYGSRAQNGALVITTKKGSRRNQGIGVEYSTSVTVSSIDKTTFPTYQTEYGQGYNGQASFNGYGKVKGGLTAPFGDDASYGPRFDPNLMVYQWSSTIPESPNFGKATPWVAAANGPIAFFNEGYNFTNSVSLNGANDRGAFRFNYTNTDASDILPNSSLSKNSFGGNASYKLNDKLTASFFANYTTQKTVGRNGTGYNGNLVAGFRQWWPVNVDLNELRSIYNATGKNYTWNVRSATNPAPAFWNNPYFERYQNYENDSRDRFNGNVTLSYDVTPSLNLLARMGTDGYTLTTEERIAAGSYPGRIGQATTANQPSGYALNKYKISEQNYDFIATYKKNISDDFNINALIGSNVNYRSTNYLLQSTSGGLKIPNLFTLSNSVAALPNPVARDISKQIIGVFAQASLGFKDTYFLEGSIRRDQSSALPKDHNSYWYPSVSGSLVFSNLIKQDWLSFGKLRAAWAKVGSDMDPNQLLDVYNPGVAFGSNVLYYYNVLKKNPEITPQFLKSTELGIETRFFHNRLGLEATWFRNDAYHQILPLPYSYTTGIDSKFENAGNMRTEGFELTASITPIKTKDFNWTLNANWSNPISKITELTQTTHNILLASLQGNVSINAPLNSKYGSIWGSDYVYANGQKLVDPTTGAYVVSTDFTHDLGSYQADWFGGLRNTFTYKNLSLGFLIDVKHGGKVFSLDQYYGYGTGLYPESLGLNDLGNPIRNSVYNTPGDPSSGLVSGAVGGVILPGVIPDPAHPGQYIQNNVRLDKSNSSQILSTDLPTSAFVYDASYVKLREASITYTLSKEQLGINFLQSMSFSVIGSNLWIIHKNVPYADPEAGMSSGNVQGYQTGVMPTTRNFSFNVKATF